MEVNNSVLSQLQGANRVTADTAAQQSEQLQERFMTLLITQIKNQDPLNPLDNAEVTSQLAQLNMVGGIERLNDTIESMAASFMSGQTLQAVNLLGRSVLVAGDSVVHSGEGGRFGAELQKPADAMTVRVIAPNGEIVERIDLGPQSSGLNTLEWDGLDSDGQPVPAGTYRLEISATSDREAVPVITLAARTVSAVTTYEGKVQIELPGIGAVSLDQVKQII